MSELPGWMKQFQVLNLKDIDIEKAHEEIYKITKKIKADNIRVN